MDSLFGALMAARGCVLSNVFEWPNVWFPFPFPPRRAPASFLLNLEIAFLSSLHLQSWLVTFWALIVCPLWTFSFFRIPGTAKLRPMHAGVLGAALACISDSEKEIRNKAEQANEALLKLVRGS